VNERPLIVAAALALWGWQTGHAYSAILLALLFEARPWIRRRLDLRELDFQRIADVTSVLFLALVFIGFSDDTVGGIYRILEWMPVVLAPLLLAQRYSVSGGIPLSALFASLRRTQGSVLEYGPRLADLTSPYVIVCLIAASVGASGREVFLLAAFLLMAALLLPRQWSWRKAVPWTFCLLLAAGAGLATQAGLYAMQQRVEVWVTRWLQDTIAASASPNHAFTAIGMLGRLKFSDRVRLRIGTDADLTAPLLLHESSYNEFRHGTWRNSGGTMTAIDPYGDGHRWRLGDTPAARARVVVTAPLKNDPEVIPVPYGTFGVASNEILGLQRHSGGALLVDARPGYLSYEVDFGPNPAGEPDPGADDLTVPEPYRNTLSAVGAELGALPADAGDRLRAVETFFRRHFTYSLVQRGRQPWMQPLNEFLLRRRSGHCEYFATATALLLRQLGIPARYAVGYSVTEYSPLERQYVARQRDAHAWVLAHVDGGWRVVDTTPATWREEEDAASRSLLPFRDVGAWIGYRWSRVRASGAGLRTALPWLLPPLVAVLLWRLRRTGSATLRAEVTAPARTSMRGSDSEFYALVDRISRRHLPPRPGETLKSWLSRLPGTDDPDRDRLAGLLELHNRHRFDPHGLSPSERAELRLAAAPLSR
jgi:transglutaminase-like putative cysteine protease